MGARESAISFMPYGPRWRTHRKLFNEFINISTVKNYDVHQAKGVTNFLVNLHRKPDIFRKHVNLLVHFTPCDADPFD